MSKLRLHEAEIKLTSEHTVILEMTATSPDDAERIYAAVQAEFRHGIVVFDEIEIETPDQVEESVSS